jgi:hypothetical protein
VSLKITGYFFFIMSTNIPTVSLSNQISCHALLVPLIHPRSEWKMSSWNQHNGRADREQMA